MKQKKFFNAKTNFAIISNMSKELDLDSKIVELLFSRNLTTKKEIEKFLNPTVDDFHNPYLLKNMQEVVVKIKNAVFNNKKILIYGDYDVDGVSATWIMLKMLEKLNCSASYFLPNRFVDGYGLTIQTIDKIKKIYNPDLIITVDCGISCYKEIEYAKKINIDIIVTDHHEIPEIIPDTLIINPKLEDQKYPFKELCGTGVAFKLTQAILGIDKCEEFLPVTALATISDIVSLTDENRAIVYLGLKLFEKFLPFGLKMMLKELKIPLKNPTSTDISFKVAPKINSSGRMGEATDSLKLYLENDNNKCKKLLSKINEYNTNRQKICNEVFNDCIKKLSDVNLSKERAIILYSKNWDSGILGIVCSRLVETYNRPTFLFSLENGILKGSARSLPEVNIHQILCELKDKLETFGGHKMAAGLCMKFENFDYFHEKVNKFIFEKVSQKAFNPIYYYDLDVDANQITEKFYHDLQKLEPFGLNNSKPLLKIQTQKAKISSLKNFNNHFNININNLNLIYFNCLNKYFSLKYSKNKNIVFEIQSKQGSQIKGIVKNFEGDFELDKSFNDKLDGFVFEQLKYSNQVSNNKINIKNYSEIELIKQIATCKNSPFGTIFVTSNYNSYKEFISKYCYDYITELFIFNNYSDAGYNGIYLYPTNLNVFKNYSKIIFLEPVLDISYLNEIKKYTDAKIYIPKYKSFNKKIFKYLDISRNSIGNFYKSLENYNKSKFLNVLHLYNIYIKKNKIRFDNFYLYFIILSELKIITFINESEEYILKINKNKTNLKNSNIYNLVNLLKNITK